MKIGIVSDIQNQVIALDKALAVFEDVGVNRIACTGDLVDGSTQGDADGVIRSLQEAEVLCVRGDQDQAVLDEQLYLRQSADLADPMTRARLISDQSMIFLTQLPKTRTYTWANHSVYIAHQLFEDDDTDLTPENLEAMQEAMTEAQADVLIVGHTRQSLHVQMNGTHIVNAGAIWNSETSGFRTCSVLHLPECVVELYDIRTGQLLHVSGILA